MNGHNAESWMAPRPGHDYGSHVVVTVTIEVSDDPGRPRLVGRRRFRISKVDAGIQEAPGFLRLQHALEERRGLGVVGAQ